MFFSDFIARNPRYIKPDGSSREAADLLAVFGEEIISFQVKSRLESKATSEKSDVGFERISRVVTKGIGQVSTTRRALRNGWLKNITTSRGLTIPIPAAKPPRLTGIVVLDLVGEHLVKPEDRTRLYGAFAALGKTPVHVFMLDEFNALSDELDTMPDFVEFLQHVRQLYEGGLLLTPPAILDLLAFYKMDPDSVADVIRNGTALILEEGIWNGYQHDHAQEIATRDRLNEPSYLIDAAIAFLHTSVGYKIPGDRTAQMGFRGQGSLEGYLTVAHGLASLSRLERRHLGERLLRCLRKAEDKTFAFSVVIDKPANRATLVMSSSMPRGDRQEFLYKLCAMAYCRLSLTKVVGLATEPLSAEWRSYDVLQLSDVRFSNAEELAKESDKFFGVPYAVTGSEYTPGSTPNRSGT